MSFHPQVRLATRADARWIAELSRDRIEHGLGWSWTASRVARSIAAPDTNVVLACDGAQRLGFGAMRYHDDEAHLLLLAVESWQARRGVGRLLVGWLEESARCAGIGQVYLEARAVNAAARAFYQRLGYRECELVAGYYQGREASVRMAHDLWSAAPAAAGGSPDRQPRRGS
ncbi:GNAT family N-acetyltransferase [Piscinibacter koreensis]|uniref:GNAT family N-acetyltransferase n=1 Tax=Piscinibacter koreensis TaxID=2742824 RepID=A0A7Y6TXA2_9BURK|nr:GNAT family N-acetyltransferase [Schlegelella koreensis]NUZ06831.1 GNAT family N-acetyltransferase [Schlegelella koreensis]